MDLPWILLFISILLIAMIAWHSSKVSLIDALKSPFSRKHEPDPLLDHYHQEVQEDLFGEQQEFLDEKPSVPAAKENLIFSLNLKAPEGRYFGGEQLLIQLNLAGLRFGDFNIFHFKDLFSLASSFEPGTFDLDRIETMRTKGLTFFMETAHIDNIREAFETMLDTAQHLAQTLRADLCDDKWQPLNEQSLERYYDQIERVTS